MRLEVVQGVDELGEPEEFSWDLFPLIRSSETSHLDQNGLPKPGTRIVPGMILVGKIGKSKCFHPAKQPDALEIHALDFQELRQKYGRMWIDRSLYATISGEVKRAYMEETPSGLKAVVELIPYSNSGDAAERLA